MTIAVKFGVRMETRTLGQRLSCRSSSQTTDRPTDRPNVCCSLSLSLLAVAVVVLLACSHGSVPRTRSQAGIHQRSIFMIVALSSVASLPPALPHGSSSSCSRILVVVMVVVVVVVWMACRFVRFGDRANQKRGVSISFLSSIKEIIPSSW